MFFQLGHPRPLFLLFSAFQTNVKIFVTNNCEKIPSNMRCWDSNPRPFISYQYNLRQINVKMIHLVSGCWELNSLSFCTSMFSPTPSCKYLSINLFRVQFEMIQWNVVTLVVDKLINLFVASLPCTLHKDF